MPQRVICSVRIRRQKAHARARACTRLAQGGAAMENKRTRFSAAPGRARTAPCSSTRASMSTLASRVDTHRFATGEAAKAEIALALFLVVALAVEVAIGGGTSVLRYDAVHWIRLASASDKRDISARVTSERTNDRPEKIINSVARTEKLLIKWLLRLFVVSSILFLRKMTELPRA